MKHSSKYGNSRKGDDGRLGGSGQRRSDGREAVAKVRTGTDEMTNKVRGKHDQHPQKSGVCRTA